MRAFFALELPDLLRNDLALFAKKIQKELPGRYLDPATYHVTLAFLDDLNVSDTPLAKETLYEALNASCYEPIHLIPTNLGTFKGSKRLTLHLALEQTSALMELAQNLRASLVDHGFSYDTKPFFPHITVARNIALTNSSIPSPILPPPGRAQYLTLFESHLTDKGAIYEPLERECLILPTA